MIGAVRIRFSIVARLSTILTLAIIHNSYACPLGYMAVSAAAVTISCQKMSLVQAAPPPVVSSDECPAGSNDVNPVGSLDPCEKIVDGRIEIVLRVGDRCPIGYARFLDRDGTDACRHVAKDNSENDPQINGF